MGKVKGKRGRAEGRARTKASGIRRERELRAILRKTIKQLRQQPHA
jgi:hypothetical protein